MHIKLSVSRPGGEFFNRSLPSAWYLENFIDLKTGEGHFLIEWPLPPNFTQEVDKLLSTIPGCDHRDNPKFHPKPSGDSLAATAIRLLAAIASR